MKIYEEFCLSIVFFEEEQVFCSSSPEEDIIPIFL